MWSDPCGHTSAKRERTFLRMQYLGKCEWSVAYEVTPMGTAWHTQTTLSYDVYIRVWLKASVSKNTARAHRNSASSHGAPVPCPAASAHDRGQEAFDPLNAFREED